METNIVNIRQSKIVSIEKLFANDYNPNRMPKKEMNLLKDCILKFGFLFPIITTWEEERGKYRIIDGYHRYETLKRIGAKEASIIDMQIPYQDAVQLTVLMNRIKGLHEIEAMSDLVVKLEDLGLTDDEIGKNLGMEAEEYIRLKEQLGISHAYKNVKYPNSWSIKK